MPPGLAGSLYLQIGARTDAAEASIKKLQGTIARMRDDTVSNGRILGGVWDRVGERAEVSHRIIALGARQASVGLLELGGTARGVAGEIGGLIGHLAHGFLLGGPIGLGIMAVSGAMHLFGGETEKAKEATEKLAAAQEKAMQKVEVSITSASDRLKQYALDWSAAHGGPDPKLARAKERLDKAIAEASGPTLGPLTGHDVYMMEQELRLAQADYEVEKQAEAARKKDQTYKDRLELEKSALGIVKEGKAVADELMERQSRRNQLRLDEEELARRIKESDEKILPTLEARDALERQAAEALKKQLDYLSKQRDVIEATQRLREAEANLLEKQRDLGKDILAQQSKALGLSSGEHGAAPATSVAGPPAAGGGGGSYGGWDEDHPLASAREARLRAMHRRKRKMDQYADDLSSRMGLGGDMGFGGGEGIGPSPSIPQWKLDQQAGKGGAVPPGTIPGTNYLATKGTLQAMRTATEGGKNALLDAQKELDDAKKALEDMKKAAEDAKKAATDQTKAVDETKSAVQDLAPAIKELKRSQDDLTKAVEALQKQASGLGS